MKVVNLNAIEMALAGFGKEGPFDHCVIDNFFETQTAETLSAEFLKYDSKSWHVYKNEIEDKKTLNDWNHFPPATYSVFRELLSEDFINIVQKNLNCDSLSPDPGLHGGGWHIHSRGGNLNPHLDYSIHPKCGMRRKINLIVYLSKEIREEHGGHLGLWSQDEKTGSVGRLVKEISPVFNRAVLFDTTQNSWHGLSRPLMQPEGIYRKSIAIYYLTPASALDDKRQRALFAPRPSQEGDSKILDLIKLRSDPDKHAQAYVTKNGIRNEDTYS